MTSIVAYHNTLTLQDTLPPNAAIVPACLQPKAY